MIILGRIRDIQPNQPRAVLELSFGAKDRRSLPHGSREDITLDINGSRWHGTINSSSTNPPYLHSPLVSDHGQRSNCTTVFLEQQLAEGAILEFDLQRAATLYLARVVSFGQWRVGNEPHQRGKISGGQPGRRPPKMRRVAQAIQPSDMEQIAAALARDFPGIQPSFDRAWSRSVAVRIIDCVLSLNRRYDAFVVPRLDQFERRQPSVTGVRDLRQLIDAHASPAEFVRRELRYDDPARAQMLSEVVDFTLTIGHPLGETELLQIEAWATAAVPSDYQQLRISGFGPAGFQYLRMLFGANTTKPDTHIRGYISDVLGRSVADLEAVNLLEAASQRLHISARDADTNIWESRAR